MLELLDSKIDKHIRIGGVDYFITGTVEVISDPGGNKENKVSLSASKHCKENDHPDFTIVVNRSDIPDITTLFSEIITVLRTITAGVYTAPMPPATTPMMAMSPMVAPWNDPNR